MGMFKQKSIAMKYYRNHLMYMLGIMLLCISNLAAQEKYAGKLPNVDLTHVKRSAGIEEYTLEFREAVADIIKQVSLDSLLASVRILTGEDPVWINGSSEVIHHRISNEGNDLAADFIKQKLQAYGLDVNDQEYSQVGRNIYAVQPGFLYPETQYIICAHYDAVPYYAADDNATGVAAVLEAARLLSRIPLAYTLVYALWDEEEIGLIGSGVYASNAYQDQEDIQGVINLDMLGWDSNNDMVSDIHSGPVANSDSLAELVMMVDSVYQLDLAPVIYDPGTSASDHSSFWNQGFGAILLIEGYYADDLHPYYHTEQDRIASINLPYYHEMSKLAIGSISSLADILEDNLIHVIGEKVGYQTYPAQLEIIGALTSFLDAQESLNVWLSFGDEIIEADSVYIASNAKLLAYFSIPTDVSMAMWDINVHSDIDGILVNKGSFEILAPPPILEVATDTIKINIEAGNDTVKYFSLANSGATDLVYDLSAYGMFQSLQFDGINDQVRMGFDPSLDLTGELSISLWYKTESPDWGVLLTNYNASFPDNGYFLCSGDWNGVYLNGSLMFECANNDVSDRVITAGSFHDSNWHHVAAVFEANGSARPKIYVDGIEQGIFHSGGDFVSGIGITPEYEFKIGASYGDGFFKGTIDEVSLWSKALSETEINTYMQKPLTGSEEDLVGYWNFNDFSDELAYDLTANKNHGTLDGGIKRSHNTPISTPDFISIHPRSGTCLPATSSVDTIRIDAGELNLGEYTGLIVISSNDPFQPVINIPLAITVTGGVGIQADKTYQGLVMKPNPVNEILTVEAGSNITGILEIRNLGGQLVYSKMMQSTAEQVDMSHYAKGIYLVTVRSGKRIWVEKVIKY